MRASQLLGAMVAMVLLSFVNGHMYLRTPTSRGGLNNNGGTTGPCGGLNAATGAVATYEAGQTATFQFRVNQHGPAPFKFAFSDGGDDFTTILKDNISNDVTAGPDGYNGVNVVVQLPSTPCDNCAIQLSGMGNAAGAGKWFNCANIKIVASLTGPNPSKITPTSGPTTGGTTVTVEGTNFGTSSKSTIKCRFDLAEVPATWVSATKVTCVSPKRNQPTPAIVEVSLDDGETYSNGGVSFSFTGDSILPEVDSIEPAYGFPGTVISIKGRNFFSDGIDCKIGNKTVGGVFVSETEVTCTVPELPMESNSLLVPVETRVDGSDFSSSGKAFTVMTEAGMTGMVAGIVVGSIILVAAVAAVIVVLVVKRGSYGAENTPSTWQKGRV